MPMNCEDIMRKELGRSMTDEEILDMNHQAELLAKQAKAGAIAANMGAQIKQLSQNWADRQNMVVLAKKRATQLALAARMKNRNYVLDSFRGMEYEGIHALMVGSSHAKPGARYSVDAIRMALGGSYIAGLFSDMEKAVPNYAKLLRDEKFEREVAQAMFLEGTGQGASFKGPAEAMELGKVIHKWQEISRNDANAAGAWIAQLPGYIVRQSHDQLKISKAGKDQFVKDIENLIDWAKEADGKYANDVQGRKDFLESVWSALASGVHKKFHAGKPDPLAKAGIIGSLAAKMSEDRILHFLDGYTWHDYNKKYGIGTLSTALFRGLEKSANDTALMRMFGPNPQRGLEMLLREVKETLRSRGNFDAIKEIENHANSYKANMKQLDGTTNIDGNVDLAFIGRSMRAFESMAKLGQAVVSSGADFGIAAQEMRYEGQSFFGSLFAGLVNIFKGRGSQERRQMLADMGVFFQSTINNISERFVGNNIDGKLSAMQHMFFTLNGQNYWTDTFKSGFSAMIAHNWASERHLSFGQLSTEKQRILSLYLIDPGLWEIIRKTPTKAADGKDYLSPEMIRSVDLAEVEAYMNSKGMIISKERVENFRNEIADRFLTMYRDRVGYAVLEPDAKAKSFTTLGLSTGTIAGEGWRFIMQFKSYIVTYLQRALGRELYGYGADTLRQGLRQALPFSGKETTGLFSLLAVTTVLGYMAMTTKHLLAGKTPRNPFESGEDFAKVLSAAMIQGGGLGIWGDFLLGEKSRFGQNFLTTLAGPVLGSLDDLHSLYQKVRDGDDATASGFRFFVNHLPGNNLFWLRPAANHLFLYSMYEMMNPGFLDRSRKELIRGTGQTYFMDPNVWDWAKDNFYSRSVLDAKRERQKDSRERRKENRDKYAAAYGR